MVSGFVGILNLDGSPVDSRMLQDLTNFLSFRGPDAQAIWGDGPTGLGHALLQVTSGATLEKQPAQLDGRLWIVADARIDARAELIDKLKAKSNAASSLSLATPDSELILRAYDSWGESCVEHLLGDFSFALWDARTKRLFCARDHFGIKLFYYAQVGSCFIVSNTCDCIRMHPAVSNRLNDLAIADFLLFDTNQDPGATSFADIHRLPPAHILSCEPGTLSTRRYWELSVNTPIHYARDQDYIDRFRELLDAAVADRLPTGSAGIMMSGGLDSTIVAASAQRILNRNGYPSGLRAYTEVYDSLIPHEERHYATLSAEALSIPIEFIASDHWKIFERADQPGYCSPDPLHTSWPDSTGDILRRVAARSRVALTGYGGDPTLLGRITVHFRQLLKGGQLGRAFGDAVRYLTAEGRFSRLYLRRRWGLLFQSRGNAEGYPPWLNEDFEIQWKLRDRWKAVNNGSAPITGVRPEAIRVMTEWTELFEGFDPDATRVPVEVRHPFYDIRLARFLLALPRLPWCCDKELLREAAREVLPDSVRLRGKSPLIADPFVALLQRPESAWIDRFEPIPELGRFVNRSRIPVIHGEKDSSTGWIHLRPLSLNFWLRSSTRSSNNERGEGGNRE